MALPMQHSSPAVRRPLQLFVLSAALSACTGGKAETSQRPEPTQRHVAHGHAVAAIERPGADSNMMLERVEDEDTHWVELPHFGECPYAEDEVPPYEPVDDGHVPKLDAERIRMTNMNAGSAKIHNEALLGLLDHATAEVLDCVSVSACYDDRALEPGSIDLEFEVAPTGEVRGVNVEPTPGLDHTGIRPCARLAIWETEFPAFDGADMLVSYELDID